MSFSNSSLITYKNISEHKTRNRNHAIDTITIHCYVGQVTAKQGCDYLAQTTRMASANYVVGKDGSIGLSVDEKDRAWTSSNGANDHRAVTIEVACDTFYPYAVTDKAYSALIKLVADICQRNGIKKLLWENNKSLIGNIERQNMTVHRWFSATACPGEYLMSRMGEIANAVNDKLITPTASNKPKVNLLYRVQVGAFKKKENAYKLLDELKSKGYTCYVSTENMYKVQVGAYSVKANADAMAQKLINDGYKAYIKTTVKE